MKIGGIICEYNPFHNGHEYQIKEMRSLGISHIVSVMSPNVVQRGELSIYDKWYRAKQAVLCGVDLVIELPCPYVLSSASSFALGGISLLKEIGCDALCFGIENDEADFFSLKQAMEKSEYDSRVKELIKSGLSYPAAMDNALDHHSLTPNNILGIEYLKSCKKLKFFPDIITIKRIGTHHDKNEPCDKYASASLIRELLYSGKDVDIFLPYASETLQPKSEMSKISSALIYKFRTENAEYISSLPEISEGLENRILRSASVSTSYEEFISSIKSKRYPMAKIKRTLLCGILGCTKEFSHSPPPYIRILAMNSHGKEILAKSAKTSSLPISSSAKDLENISPSISKWIEIEKKSSDLFELSSCSPIGKPNPEYTQKPFSHL